MQETNDELKRSLGFWSAISIVVGTIIGSGIFFKQASVFDATGSSTLTILAWILGGLITLTGGLTIAEIGSQMPYTGGLYVYIENLYGRKAGFLAGWAQIIVYGPAVIGSLAGFISIMCTNLFSLSQEWRVPLAVAAILVISLINLFENRVGAAFSMITTVAKMVPIAAIIIFGLLWGKENAIGQTISQLGHSGGGFGVAILATLFAYDGWILIANLGGEMKKVQQVLPKTIVLGIGLVLLIYTLISLSFLRFLPVNVLHWEGANAAVYLAKKIFGATGGKLLSIGIVISMLGTLNGKMLTFPRIAYAMARRRDLPFSRYLAYTTPKGKSPIVATLFITFIATIMMCFFDPDHLSDLCIFTIYCFYLMAFMGIFILRKKKPGKRPFSTPLYPLVPLIAIAGGLFILISEILNDGGGVFLFAGLVIIGLPIFYAVKRMDKKRLK